MPIAEPSTGPTGVPCDPQKVPGGEHDLEGCLASPYGTGGCELRLPEEGHTLAPWVAITFEGSGSVITVGNQSSSATDPQHVACIKSFEFGYSDGLTMRCTIHDEQGGSFVQFMHNLLKDWICMQNGAPAAVRMKVQFGWAKGSCGAAIPTAMFRCYYCLSDAVETNFNEGKFSFEITGKDLCHRMFEGGTNLIYGGEGQNAIPITDAIRRFMTVDCPPTVGNVKFCRMEGGHCVDCPFKYCGTISSSNRNGSGGGECDPLKGPKGKWIANGQDKLRVVMRWLEGHVTDRDKGWIPQYNSEVPNGELIFWEDSKPREPQGDGYWDANCIGIYIVNGGHKSPVIEFNPKIRWDFARLTSAGGNLGDARPNALNTPGSTQPGYTIPNLDAPAQPCAGQNTQTTNTETQRDNHGANAQQVQQEGNNAAFRGLKILTDNIEADLVIVGDPTILPPSEAMWAKNVTVILVNPYYIRHDEMSDTGLEWLSKPVCNEVLSSKAWICKSIQHRIEAGKYTTTVGVFLTTPGADTPPNTPIGAWTEGWRPTNPC
jgi:hypothetical protein